MSKEEKMTQTDYKKLCEELTLERKMLLEQLLVVRIALNNLIKEMQKR